jgi:hypothetical protein
MLSISSNASLDDGIRRDLLYQGHLFSLPPSRASIALCDFAQELIEEAFAPNDPRTAQFEIPVEDFVTLVAPLQPRFIHHPKTKDLVVDYLVDSGCDPEKTYFDVPRLRVISSSGYLTSGVGYQLHPHRDTWYSAPACQLNWWLPIYDILTHSAMAFHPAYWEQAIRNSSRDFNYYEWNRDGRRNAANHITSDTRKQPRAEEELYLEPDVRLVPPRGGIILFSGAHLHSTVPNTSGVTRFSMDFRTIHHDDVIARRGAPNQDWECSGTSLRDFIRCSDRQPLSQEIVATYDIGSRSNEGVLVYQP